jgi:hypothetical protein
MVQPVMSQSAAQLCITSESMDERLARAYLRGLGDEVLEVWRAIADNRLSRESQEIWTKKVADWIMTTAEPARRRPPLGFAVEEYFYRPAERSERVQAALVTSGFAEPMLDTLDDERLLLDCAIELKSRDAAENIWRLIASDKATQFLRDEWLSHVSKGVWKAVKSSAQKSVNANRRGDSMLSALGIFGKKAADTKKEKLRIFVGIMKRLGPSCYNVSPRYFANFVVDKLKICGVIDEDLKGDALEAVKSLIRKELTKRSSSQ